MKACSCGFRVKPCYLTFIKDYCRFVFPGSFGMNLYPIISLEPDGVFVVPRALSEPRSGVKTMIGNRLFGVVTQQPKESELNGIAVVSKLQMTIKSVQVIALILKNKHMHTYIHKTNIPLLPFLSPLSLHHQLQLLLERFSIVKHYCTCRRSSNSLENHLYPSFPENHFLFPVCV